MKTLNRYIVSSILKTSIIATIVFSLILAGVELFQKMDSIITGGVEFSSVLVYALLCIPEYFIMVLSISLLFGATYFQSSLSANNERIAILNAGISKWRMCRPVFVLALILTAFGFLLSETVIKDLEIEKTQLSDELFGTSSTQDSRNIVLKSDNGWVVYTRRFSESDSRIVSPIFVHEENGELQERITADEGYYQDEGYWKVYNATVYSRNAEGEFTLERLSELDITDFTLSPDYFRAENINVETMDFEWALDYLSTLKTTQREAWREKCTDYLRRFFQPLSILLLLCISASFDYNLKKNVLLFSVIESLCVAVVYYVADMVFSIFAHQGAFSPVFAVILPIVTTIVLAAVINEFGKRV